jgi:hypothetical protein
MRLEQGPLFRIFTLEIPTITARSGVGSTQHALPSRRVLSDSRSRLQLKQGVHASAL